MEQPAGVVAPILEVKSIESLRRCTFHVYNLRDREIDVIWINYSGEEKKYISIKSRNGYMLNSYATHPWIFRDRINRTLQKVDVSIGTLPAAAEAGTSFHANRAAYNETFRKYGSFRVFIVPRIPRNLTIFVFIRNELFTLRELSIRTLCSYSLPRDKLILLLPKSVGEEVDEYRDRQNKLHFFLDRI